MNDANPGRRLIPNGPTAMHFDCEPPDADVATQLMSCPQCGEPIVNPDDARMVLINDVFMVEHVGCRVTREAVAP